MDEQLKKYYKKQVDDIRNRINTCDYTNQLEVINIMSDIADMLQNILNEF